MKKEIELKFVVDQKYLPRIIEDARRSKQITQAFMFNSPNIRIRNIINPTNSKESWIIIKGERYGIVRDEFEYSIPYKEGLILMETLGGTPVIKTRYILKYGKDIWEIDDFHGGNNGLLMAEVEIPNEDYEVDLPDWIDAEDNVSRDYRYYNSYLAEHPFSEWKIEG